MVENECSKCGQQVEYAIWISSDKFHDEYIKDNSEALQTRIEHWCLDCLREKIVWPKP